MEFRRVSVAIAVVALAVAALTGCSSHHTDRDPAASAWLTRMSGFLTNVNGQGGAGGVLGADSDDSADSEDSPKAHGSAELGSIVPGDYDVLAVCGRASVVHIAVRAAEGKKLLGSSDVPCGATVRLHVTVPAGGVTISASAPSSAKQGEWWAGIEKPGWDPGVIGYG